MAILLFVAGPIRCSSTPTIRNRCSSRSRPLPGTAGCAIDGCSPVSGADWRRPPGSTGSSCWWRCSSCTRSIAAVNTCRSRAGARVGAARSVRRHRVFHVSCGQDRRPRRLADRPARRVAPGVQLAVGSVVPHGWSGGFRRHAWTAGLPSPLTSCSPCCSWLRSRTGSGRGSGRRRPTRDSPCWR